jgi:hypothetical protein
MSAATLDAPNTECLELSIDIVSSIPNLKNVCDSSISNRVSVSINGRKLGVSPYTLLVDVNMKTASEQCCRVNSSKFNVPVAFTPKSVSGSLVAPRYAQSLKCHCQIPRTKIQDPNNFLYQYFWFQNLDIFLRGDFYSKWLSYLIQKSRISSCCRRQ